ncbi:DUF4435 domain-containing protein [Bacillus altitudinis]|uniref:DUF4435 domain-containing protein n=1 Tax=Bacillus altitudinis TaxID=293387 RepID=UPI00227E35DF|nr:DUF4435 domain-containing protein [Bacillus altitudinis]MCY7716080.1 DUF4435 domain-containing protein [Bacillus altitudinis]
MTITKKFMKESLKETSVVWMDFSMKYAPFHGKNHIHCFFEGEDRKYYLDRIERYTNYSAKDILSYDCKGKVKLLQIKKKIDSKSKYNKVVKAFFVDRDYGLHVYDKDETIYETPYHSLENFYVNKDTLERLLIKEFGLNFIDSDFNKILNDFIDCHKSFQELMAPINAFIISFQELDSPIIINKFKIEDFVEISIQQIIKLKENTFDCLKEYYLDKLMQDVRRRKKNSEDNLDNFNQIIDKVNEGFFKNLSNIYMNRDTLIHGKFELYFFRKIIENLKCHNNNGQYFTRKLHNINIDIHSNNILSNLSQYALTPDCLIEFLKKYSYVNEQEIIN